MKQPVPLTISFGANLRRRVALASLKACPFCGSVNANRNSECFVCRWHGEFSRDPEIIIAGIDQLVERCPELADVILQSQIWEPNRWDKFCFWISRLLKIPIDLRV